MSEPTLSRILYVEDDADIREIVKMSLKMLGQFQVAACDSCATALSLVDEFSPELLLLDVMMPDVDGPATLRMLRERVSASTAPAIFITAKVEPGDMQRYSTMGVVDVIVKPFDTMLLPSQIEQIWQRHRSSLHDSGG
jgi:DNA-binding response OmpR family regulator